MESTIFEDKWHMVIIDQFEVYIVGFVKKNLMWEEGWGHGIMLVNKRMCTRRSSFLTSNEDQLTHPHKRMVLKKVGYLFNFQVIASWVMAIYEFFYVN